MTQLHQLQDWIQTPSLSSVVDRWEWDLNGSKEFSVAVLKRHLADHRSQTHESVFFWNNWVPRKVGILSWRAGLNRLPVRTLLARRNIVIASDVCPVCGEIPESVDHLFVECGFAQSIWAIISQWCGIPPVYAFSFKDLLDIQVYIRRSTSFKKALNGIILVTIWCIWGAWNDKVFNSVEVSLQKTIKEIKAKSFLWIKAYAQLHDLSWSSWNVFDVRGIGW